MFIYKKRKRVRHEPMSKSNIYLRQSSRPSFQVLFLIKKVCAVIVHTVSYVDTKTIVYTVYVMNESYVAKCFFFRSYGSYGSRVMYPAEL